MLSYTSAICNVSSRLHSPHNIPHKLIIMRLKKSVQRRALRLKIDAVPNMLRTPYPLLAAMWLVLFVCSLVLCCWFIVVSIDEYSANPVTTSAKRVSIGGERLLPQFTIVSLANFASTSMVVVCTLNGVASCLFDYSSVALRVRFDDKEESSVANDRFDFHFVYNSASGFNMYIEAYSNRPASSNPLTVTQGSVHSIINSH